MQGSEFKSQYAEKQANKNKTNLTIEAIAN
jgi:hypothetical protein